MLYHRPALELVPDPQRSAAVAALQHKKWSPCMMVAYLMVICLLIV